MKRHLIPLCGLIGILLSSGCKEKEATYQPASPQMEARYDRSVAPIQVDVEKGMQQPKNLKLSQIGSEIEYYIVGDATFGVTQAIAIPDSNAFITFNNPRIYYRKQGIPSKRFGFKALDYKWNNAMGGRPLFYDKKTTRTYVALSGIDKTNKKDSLPGIPSIGELPPLDTMLTIFSHIFPESLEKKYSLNTTRDSLLGFSSTGYTLCNYDANGNITGSITTVNMKGDTLCQIPLTHPSPSAGMKNIPKFQTYFWNEAQDMMSFMIPYCDTVFQLKDAQTVAPLYAIHFGAQGVNSGEATGDEADKGKIELRTLQENPKALFLGFYQDGKRPILNWLGLEETYKPLITNQALYLKENGEIYVLPNRSKGIVNDLDEAYPFWPDGQTDNCLYMIRSVTEMRTTLERSGSPKQQKLIELLDNPNVHERDYVMIVVR